MGWRRLLGLGFRLDRQLDLGLILVACSHVFLCPYTKVEESFSIQAIHDALAHGLSPTSLSKYDHNVFPGAVPRSFIGPLLLCLISYPVLLMLKVLGLLQSSAQAALSIRLVLAILYSTSLIFFSYQTCNQPRTLSRNATLAQTLQRRAFILLSTAQFHPLFWAGRTTPNGIVSPIVITALAMIFSTSKSASNRDYHLGLALLTASQVVARMELVGIVLSVALCGLFSKQKAGAGFARQFAAIATTGLCSAMASVALSVLVDTYFWGRPFSLWNPLHPSAGQVRGVLWPELEAILFNVVEGKSSDWGTSPWHSYLTSHLPKLLSFATPLCLLGLFTSKDFSMLFVSLFHVATLSQVGHKETRFVSYLIPLLNTFAARGAVLLWTSSPVQSSVGRRAAKAVVLCAFAATALVSLVSLRASANNYAGGEAMRALHDVVQHDNVTVHIDVLPAMTGVNLMQSIHLPRSEHSFRLRPLPSVLVGREDDLVWIYDKTEDLDPTDADQWRHFSHLISDNRICHLPDQFERLDLDAFVEFDRLTIKQPRQWLSSLRHAPTHCLSTGLPRWACLEAILPVHFRWRESVWLCRRKITA